MEKGVIHGSKRGQVLLHGRFRPRGQKDLNTRNQLHRLRVPPRLHHYPANRLSVMPQPNMRVIPVRLKSLFSSSGFKRALGPLVAGVKYEPLSFL